LENSKLLVARVDDGSAIGVAVVLVVVVVVVDTRVGEAESS
jgi:hypothetical protein